MTDSVLATDLRGQSLGYVSGGEADGSPIVAVDADGNGNILGFLYLEEAPSFENPILTVFEGESRLATFLEYDEGSGIAVYELPLSVRGLMPSEDEPELGATAVFYFNAKVTKSHICVRSCRVPIVERHEVSVSSSRKVEVLDFLPPKGMHCSGGVLLSQEGRLLGLAAWHKSSIVGQAIPVSSFMKAAAEVA